MCCKLFTMHEGIIISRDQTKVFFWGLQSWIQHRVSLLSEWLPVCVCKCRLKIQWESKQWANRTKLLAYYFMPCLASPTGTGWNKSAHTHTQTQCPSLATILEWIFCVTAHHISPEDWNAWSVNRILVSVSKRTTENWEGGCLCTCAVCVCIFICRYCSPVILKVKNKFQIYSGYHLFLYLFLKKASYFKK